jgi:hypothetical protein
MNKLISFIYTAQTIISCSLIASAGFLFLPSPSIAEEIPGREKAYRNCAELQKHLNDNNPGDKYEGFEKAKMMRRNLDYEKYIIFCNGGIVTDASEGTICRGYIAYSYAGIPATARYYARWGQTKGLPNDSDTGQKYYCRWIK